jgi:L-fuconolactonase
VASIRDLVVDAHVHFWDPGVLHYPWLRPVPELERTFLPGDYDPFREGDGAVDAVVFVEANCAPGEGADEVAFVEGLAMREPRVTGVVAFADLLDEQARSLTLDRLSKRPRVAGVRYSIQGHPAGFALQRAFVRGVQEVGSKGLTFDVCATATQLPDVAELVRRCPGTRFVLDHCGKPAIRDDAFDNWGVDLARLAAHDHICCKLSGLLTEARSDQRVDAALAPYAEHVVACFGAERIMYGSDWPVVTLAGGVAEWRGFVDRFTAGWSPDERRCFYAANAIRTYGLTPNATN